MESFQIHNLSKQFSTILSSLRIRHSFRVLQCTFEASENKQSLGASDMNTDARGVVSVNTAMTVTPFHHMHRVIGKMSYDHMSLTSPTHNIDSPAVNHNLTRSAVRRHRTVTDRTCKSWKAVMHCASQTILPQSFWKQSAI